VLKLYPRPVARATAWVGAKDIDALVQLLAQLRAACGERLVAFEMLSAESLALILAARGRRARATWLRPMRSMR
jgi:FAD/FMN-containing dehydrogenase